MRTRTGLFLIVAFAAGCGSPDDASLGELTASVVYGTDDRVEVFNHPDEALRLITAKSIVALLPDYRIERQPDGTYAIIATTLMESKGLCEDERFVSQPSAAVCSGVLIDDDLVLTAGHCVRSERNCEELRFVFNYFLDGPDQPAVIEDKDVYSCGRIAVRKESVGEPLTPDYAIVQLERAVTGSHGPIAIPPASAVPGEGEPVTMIGSGSGLPAKIDSGGAVAEPRADTLDYFVTNSDAFLGHSGSATLDSSNRLAGILIAGREPDYVSSPGEECKRVNTFDDIDAGEAIHHIAPIIAGLCESGWSSEKLCGETSCDGEPCGMPAPDNGKGSTGVVPASSSGCSVSQRVGFEHGWAALLLILAVLGVRRRAA